MKNSEAPPTLEGLLLRVHLWSTSLCSSAECFKLAIKAQGELDPAMWPRISEYPYSMAAVQLLTVFNTGDPAPNGALENRHSTVMTLRQGLIVGAFGPREQEFLERKEELRTLRNGLIAHASALEAKLQLTISPNGYGITGVQAFGRLSSGELELWLSDVRKLETCVHAMLLSLQASVRQQGWHTV